MSAIAGETPSFHSRCLSMRTVLLAASLVVAVGGGFACRWQFHTCRSHIGRPGCFVTLRRDCACDNETACPLPPALTVVRAEAESLLLNQSDPLPCDASCRIEAVRCQWEAWDQVVCPRTRRRRRRGTCCHPVTKKTLSWLERVYTATCLTGGFEYGEEVHRCEPQEVGTANRDSLSGKSTIYIVIGVFGTTAVICSICLSRWGVRKRKRRMMQRRANQNSSAMLMEKTHTVPDQVIIPEPGQPINVEHLPSQFKNK